MKKIIFIDDSGEIGGAEKVLLSLLENLNRDIYLPEVIVGTEGNFKNRIENLGIKCYLIQMHEWKTMELKINALTVYKPLAFLYNFLSFLHISCRLLFFFYQSNRKTNIDFIHTNGIKSQICASFAAKILGIKIIWHEHTIQPSGLRRLIIGLMGNLFPERIIAVSNAVKNSYCFYLKNLKKIVTIHNGIYFNKTYISSDRIANIKEKFGIPKNVPVVGMASFLRPWKGHEVFLKAAKIVVSVFKNVKFLIVGNTQFKKEHWYKNYLLELSKDLGISEYVYFLGFLEDPITVIAMLDILISASVLEDPFPTVILEAQASAVPVIATNIGGSKEIIEDGITGYLIPPGDENTLAQKICMLLNDPVKRIQMGYQGRKRIESNFTIVKFVREIERVYSSL
jgi:glycosyltransferase involved in cell wall biosynthesis